MASKMDQNKVSSSSRLNSFTSASSKNTRTTFHSDLTFPSTSSKNTMATSHSDLTFPSASSKHTMTTSHSDSTYPSATNDEQQLLKFKAEIIGLTGKQLQNKDITINLLKKQHVSDLTYFAEMQKLIDYILKQMKKLAKQNSSVFNDCQDNNVTLIMENLQLREEQIKQMSRVAKDYQDEIFSLTEENQHLKEVIKKSSRAIKCHQKRNAALIMENQQLKKEVIKQSSDVSSDYDEEVASLIEENCQLKEDNEKQSSQIDKLKAEIAVLSDENQQLKAKEEKHQIDLATIDELKVERLKHLLVLKSNAKKLEELEKEKHQSEVELRKLTLFVNNNLLIFSFANSEEAIQHYKNAIQDEGSTSKDSKILAELHFQLAKLYSQSGEMDDNWKAIDTLNAVIMHSPNHIPSLKLRATVLLRIGHYSGAKKDLETVLRLDSEDKEARKSLNFVVAQMNGLNLGDEKETQGDNSENAFDTCNGYESEVDTCNGYETDYYSCNESEKN